jgi:hypothetical protein
MSKGPGKVQREIAALIEADPDGAWAYEELGRLTYGWAGRPQKSAFGHALKTMRLPGTWTVMQASFRNDRRFWLFDPCRLESWRKIAGPRCDPANFQPGGVYFNWTEEAQRRAARHKALREAGWTTRDVSDAVLLHEVVKVLGKSAMDQMVEFQLKAGERAHRRMLRQMAWLVSHPEKNPP